MRMVVTSSWRAWLILVSVEACVSCVRRVGTCVAPRSAEALHGAQRAANAHLADVGLALHGAQLAQQRQQLVHVQAARVVRGRGSRRRRASALDRHARPGSRFARVRRAAHAVQRRARRRRARRPRGCSAAPLPAQEMRPFCWLLPTLVPLQPARRGGAHRMVDSERSSRVCSSSWPLRSDALPRSMASTMASCVRAHGSVNKDPFGATRAGSSAQPARNAPAAPPGAAPPRWARRRPRGGAGRREKAACAGGRTRAVPAGASHPGPSCAQPRCAPCSCRDDRVRPCRVRHAAACSRGGGSTARRGVGGGELFLGPRGCVPLAQLLSVF
jgi:hypothetical protein